MHHLSFPPSRHSPLSSAHIFCKSDEAAIADAETGKASEEKVNSRVKAVTRENRDNVLFETRDGDATLHRNLLVK